MGCDIHGFVEVKKDGKWLVYSQIDRDRDYKLFAKMANVRNFDSHVEPISDPRGLPDDVSEVAKIESDYFDSDGHSHSWLSKEEIASLREWILEENKKSPFKTTFKLPYVAQYPEDYPRYEDVRIVFWFDN